MIKRNKVIAGVLLFTVLLSGIPEGFGAVSDVYAEEPVAPVEAAAESEPETESETRTPEGYPSFKQSKTVNGVNVTVEADAGVFPEDAKLSVQVFLHPKRKKK